MGMWGIEAYDNDCAADWLSDLMDSTKLREAWLKGINTDLDDEPEIPRAAVWLFVQLGYVYVWPIANYNKDLELAISVADRLRHDDYFLEVAGMKDKLEQEYSELVRRRHPQGKNNRLI
ncbi:MAG: DUF4259 domain-containing protein [Cyanobacteria bacterium P01_E01_bin.42]